MIINEGWQVWRGGVAVGAVILDPEGKHETTFEWGYNLEVVTNNQAEAHTLYHGLIILQGLNIKNVMVLGDSSLVID